jgi:hypothetical protein
VVAKGLLLTALITRAVMERLDKVITAVLHTGQLTMPVVAAAVLALLAAMVLAAYTALAAWEPRQASADRL